MHFFGFFQKCFHPLRVKRFFHNNKAFPITLLLSAFFLMAGCERSAPSTASPPQVDYIRINTVSIPLTKELSGRANAYVVAEVRPQVSGIIQARLFTEGDDVKAGDTLYQIDPALYRAARQRAEASVKETQANLEVLRLTEKRYAGIVDRNAISRQQYDDTVAARKQAEARLALAEAERETATINLNYTRVTSPVDGRIGRSSVTPGALVTQNQAEALATVQQIDPLYVDITESSVDYLRWKEDLRDGNLHLDDDALRVTLILDNDRPYVRRVALRDAGGNIRYETEPVVGSLEFEGITVDRSTGMLGLRAVFPNPDHLLLPGMYVRAVLNEGVRHNAILVPKRAVFRNNRGEAVAQILMRRDSAGAEALYDIETRIVVINRSIGNYWLIDSGLADGDLLMVEGFSKVRAGQPVTAEENPDIAARQRETVLTLQQQGR